MSNQEEPDPAGTSALPANAASGAAAPDAAAPDAAAPDAAAPEAERSPDPPPIAKGAAFFLVGLLIMHFTITFFWNAPPNPIKDVVGGQVSSYMRPFFEQNWSLFAPNPVNSEDELLVRAKVRDPGSGAVETTEWVSATRAEWTLVAGSPAPSRASRLSSNLHRRLNSAWNRLAGEQQDIVAQDYEAMDDWTPLAEDLIEAQGGDTSARVATMVRADRVATGYATQVARATWGEDVVAVQFQLERTPVPRWFDRFEPVADDPASTIREFGWRPVLVNPGQDESGFAATFDGFGG